MVPNTPVKSPRHVAIIMDGNGRWAAKRGLPRSAGHRQGVEAVRRITRKAREMGIDYLTLYSFSTENWSRPATEINELFSLLKMFIRRDLAELHQNNVRVVVIGDRDGVPDDIWNLLIEAQRLTIDNTAQTLVIAFNYGSRTEIAAAARKIAEKAVKGEMALDDIDESAISGELLTTGIPDPDLIIRTSGEMRLSNFLLWQAAYSEFYFSQANWPEFTPELFEAAIAEYSGRKRRFGGVDEIGARETGS